MSDLYPDDVLKLAETCASRIAASPDEAILLIAAAIIEDRSRRAEERPSGRSSWPPEAGELIDGLEPIS